MTMSDESEIKLIAKGDTVSIETRRNEDGTATLSITMPAERLDAWLEFLKGME